MGFLTSWAVDGSRTPAAVARMAQYAATPDPGVVEPDHCKLVVLGANTVGLTAGACVVSAGASGSARWQSYVVAVDSTDGDAVATVPMPSAAARTLYAVVVVPDPQWAGVPAPADPLSAAYAELRVVTAAQRAALSMPWYQVATLSIPANATGLATGMVTDNRRLSRPKQRRHLFSYNLIQADGLQDLSASHDPQYWPAQEVLPGSWEVDVPSWAVTAQIVAGWGGIQTVPTAGKHGVIYARLGRPAGYAQGNVETQHQRWDLGNSATGREHWEVADDVGVPAALRGTRQPVRLLGYRLETLSGRAPRLDSASAVKFDIEFQGAPI